MLLRMSTLFLRTLRDDPADAEVPSHRLLVRAGYVRRVAPGIYTWLPLGIQLLRNIERIVREEMAAIGSQEVLFPALIPREIFEASGRWADYGDGLFRLTDRKKADYLLGPTHEELFTLLVKGEYSSYKDFPLSLYQIQTKFRDEARPRAGVLRGREFIMKDSYSFDVSDEGLQAAYQAHRDAYERIFTRLGFDYRIVFAVSGAMGGSASEEFLAPTPSGEDTFVQCTDCDYAANTEAVEIAVPPAQDGAEVPASVVLDTPDTQTITSLVDALNGYDWASAGVDRASVGVDRASAGVPARTFSAADTLKNVVLKTRQPGSSDWQLLVVGVPGDREVDLKRLSGQLEPVEVEVAGPEDLARQPGLVRGYIGPQVLAELKVRYLVDPLVVPGSSWVTGANEADRHVAFVVRGRDFTPDGEIGAVEIRDGDRCARCGSPLQIARGIELGHVFQLGRKFAEAFGLTALGPDGKPVTITMGSYGVGITRAAAALAEQTYDASGLCWPRAVAPADVQIVATGKDPVAFAEAERLATELVAAGVRVLLDDRKASPGVKFKDAELLGVPTILIVGRGLDDGVVELRDRKSGDRQDVPVGDAISAVQAAIAG
ncbi:MAG: proline--tRNA ligase [Actinomycetota bacterium]|nr:proline--tRNA ligase [Actinomycetota bacterium]MDQ2958431.1 proline--tRNA ligase [Actinomycetota bacterium]